MESITKLSSIIYLQSVRACAKQNLSNYFINLHIVLWDKDLSNRETKLGMIVEFYLRS